MARFLRFGEQILVSRVVFIGQQVLKLKLGMTRILHGPASLLAAGPLNVWKSHNLLNWLRKTHARGGHCCHMGPSNCKHSPNITGMICEPFTLLDGLCRAKKDYSV